MALGERVGIMEISFFVVEVLSVGKKSSKQVLFSTVVKTSSVVTFSEGFSTAENKTRNKHIF